MERGVDGEGGAVLAPTRVEQRHLPPEPGLEPVTTQLLNMAELRAQTVLQTQTLSVVRCQLHVLASYIYTALAKITLQIFAGDLKGQYQS